jgi:hypothetical protein
MINSLQAKRHKVPSDTNLFPKNIALRLLKRIILIYSNFVIIIMFPPIIKIKINSLQAKRHCVPSENNSFPKKIIFRFPIKRINHNLFLKFTLRRFLTLSQKEVL